MKPSCTFSLQNKAQQGTLMDFDPSAPLPPVVFNHYMGGSSAMYGSSPLREKPSKQ